MSKTLSQGDLLVPVLKALTDLGPGAHPFPDVVKVALGHLGLTVDCMGEKDGRPLVYTTASNAGFSLRARGCMTSTGRAWEITDLGREVGAGRIPMPKPGSKPEPPAKTKTAKAKTAKAKPAPTTTESAATEAPAVETEATEPESPVDAPAVETEAPETAPVEASPEPVTEKAPEPKKSLPVVEKVPDWVADPYIRGLVASNTPCYGSWSPKSTPCAACVIAAHCRSAQAGALSMLASRLRESEVTKSTAKLHTATASALNTDAPRAGATPIVGKSMRAHFDGLCARSGVPIKAGEECYYVPGEGVVSAAAYTGKA